MIRSDRRAVIGIHSELEFEFGSFEVSNYSATVSPSWCTMGTDALQCDGGLRRFAHRRWHQELVFISSASRVRSELPTGEGRQVAFELKSGVVPIDRIHTVIKFRKVLNGFVETQQG